MGFTGVDSLIGGFQPPVTRMKIGITMASVSAPSRAYTPWYHPGTASVAGSVGVNGEAVTPALGASVQGRIPRSNPGGSLEARIARAAMYSNQTGTLWIVDRVWQNSGLSATSTSLQSITPAALPSRDRNGLTDGDDIIFAIEHSATGGAGTPTLTLTYTDQDGNTGATSTLTAVTTPPVGTLEIFPWAAGDTGVRAPTGYQASATRTSGTFHLIGFRILAVIDFPIAGPGVIDPLGGNLPRIYDDSVLQEIWLPTGTTAVSLMGTLTEAWA